VKLSRDDQALAASALVQGLPADAPIGFAVHDELLRFELVSDSLAAINGRPAADHLGRRVAEILPPDLAGPVDALLAEVRDTGTARTAIEMDGWTHARPEELRSWVAGFYPMALADRRLVGVVLVDVTDRRRAQQALSESEAVLSGAQRMAGVGWWTWTAHPESVVYAPELLWLMGRDPALGGTPHARDLLEMADPSELDSVRATALASLETGRPFVRRIRARTADGELRLLEGRADVVCDAAGRAVGLQGFVQDVTELARAEQRQRVVAELGRRALEEPELDVLLQEAVEAVGREVGVDGVGALEVLPGGQARVRAGAGQGGFGGPRVVPIEPGGVIDRALRTREPVVVEDLTEVEQLGHATLERAAGARSVATVVIDGRRGPFGVIGAMSGRPSHFSADDTAFLTAVANVLAGAVERTAAHDQIAEISAARGRLVAQAIDAEDRARRTISEALHDRALQDLIAVRNELFAMTGRGGDDAALEAAQRRLVEIISRLREVMSALHPTVLQYGGLEAALHAVAEQHGGAAAFEAAVTVDPSAAGAHDELVLSLARELLENTAQHASATRAEVAVRAEPSAIVLSVADDGAGFPPGRLEAALAGGAIGVASCRERVEALGGTFTVQAAPGAGTRAEARIPAGAGADPDRPASMPGDTDAPDRE